MMKKELKDYLNLYLGCEVETNIPGQYVHPYGCVKLENLTPENLYRILDRIDINERNKQTWDEDSDHYCKLILRPLSDMTDSEINDIVSIMLGREVTCGRIWRSEDKDFIIADFKQEKPLPPYNEKYKSMSMEVYIKGDFQVDYKWNYYTEENCEGSCGVTDEPLHNHNEITRYMLSKHFDVFGLIDAGLAIDKTKL